MKRPEELSADYLWRLLGEYASTVADAEGVLFTDDKWVIMACDQYEKEQKK